MTKKKMFCDFCGGEATNNIKIENLLNLAFCSDNECHRKFHCILSTIIPNKEYEIKLIVKKRKGYVEDINLAHVEVEK